MRMYIVKGGAAPRMVGMRLHEAAPFQIDEESTLGSRRIAVDGGARAYPFLFQEGAVRCAGMVFFVAAVLPTFAKYSNGGTSRNSWKMASAAAELVSVHGVDGH